MRASSTNGAHKLLNFIKYFFSPLSLLNFVKIPKTRKTNSIVTFCCSNIQGFGVVSRDHMISVNRTSIEIIFNVAWLVLFEARGALNCAIFISEKKKFRCKIDFFFLQILHHNLISLAPGVNWIRIEFVCIGNGEARLYVFVFGQTFFTFYLI